MSVHNDHEGQRDIVADITAPHRDKGLARKRGRERFRVERVMIRLNFWMRLKSLFAGSIITFGCARAPQKVSGVEITEVVLLSARQLRKLEKMRLAEEAKKLNVFREERKPWAKTAGDEAVAALKGLTK